MTELNSKNPGISQIQIADEVIAIIAGTSALETEGVAGMAGSLTGDLTEKLGRKNLAKGVKIVVVEGSVVIDISVSLKFGSKIPEVCENIQTHVKNAVETMTGLSVSTVNIFVSSISGEPENSKKDSAKSVQIMKNTQKKPAKKNSSAKK